MTPLELAREAVAAALRAGATSADAAYTDGEHVEVRVRLSSVERVEEARSCGVCVRAFRGHRLGLAFTNDVSPQGVQRAAAQAADLASVAAEDAAMGLPDAEDLGVWEGDLDVVDADVGSYDVAKWREAARAAEAAALSHAGIAVSDGGRAGGGTSRIAVANSRGFAAERVRTASFVTTGVLAAGKGDEKLRAGYGRHAPHFADLPTPQQIGDEAARRALRAVGWRKPPTGPVPVVLAPEVARDFAQTLAQALSASAVFRRGTFLADSMGQTVGTEALGLVDDATLPRRAGSRRFDGEGVRARRTVLIERGEVTSWLANAYAARRTGWHTTGAAARAPTGDTVVHASNLVLTPGRRKPQDLIGEIASGLYVTDLFGFGVNLASGAWSRGGNGLWIEGGRLAHPVQELTVAGDLRQMLRGYAEAADDLEWDGSCAAPTVRIDGLTVAAG